MCDRNLLVWNLLLGILIHSFLGMASIQSPDPPNVQVKGILGGSALFPLNIPPGENISEIKWDYESQGEKTMIAEFSDGKMNCTNPSNHFGQRLEMVSQVTLRIVDLKMEDSGIYIAEVQFDTAAIGTYPFTLAVCKPLSEPQSLCGLISDMPQRCNVSLWCPVDQKNVSSNLPDICLYPSEIVRCRWILVAIAALLFACIFIIYLCIKLRRETRELPDHGGPWSTIPLFWSRKRRNHLSTEVLD